MPNKSYKLYNGGVSLTFEFNSKLFNIKISKGLKAIITYYENDLIKQMYGRINNISLTNGEENDKLVFQINNISILFSSIISIDVIEMIDSIEPIDVTGPENPTIITSLKDLQLSDMDDFYLALNADDAFREIGQKIKSLGSGEAVIPQEYIDKINVISNNGLGNKFLSDNGFYKAPPTIEIPIVIDDINVTGVDTTFSASKIVSEIVKATENKVEAIVGKGLSTNDYDTIDKNKVGTINTAGDGTTFLASDGTYKLIEIDESASIDDANASSLNTTFSASKIVSEIVKATENKVEAVIGKGLSTNDYDTIEKTKVAVINTAGDGTTFLASDGTYKLIEIDESAAIDDTNVAGVDTTLSASKIISEITKATENKVEAIVGKGLSTNDYDAEEKSKVAVIDKLGDGTTFLANDGTYKPIEIDKSASIDDVNISLGTTYSSQKIEDELSDRALATHSHSEYENAAAKAHDHANKLLIDLITDGGDGTTFLASDGTYKTPPVVSSGAVIDDVTPSIESTYSSSMIDEKLGQKAESDQLHTHVNKIIIDSITDQDIIDWKAVANKIISSGLGTKFLSDDGIYRSISELSDIVTINDADLISLTSTLSASKIASEIVKATENKVEAIVGKGLSTNDYDTIDKNKVGVINTAGDGTTFLASDGTYKLIENTGTSTDDTTAAEITTMINTIWGVV